jgi:PIN domain nuclease of toxin-antitoxin system
MGSAGLILLDTHMWIWFNLAPELLPREVGNAISERNNEFCISAMSIWETILAAKKGRISLLLGPEESVREWLLSSLMAVIPLDSEIAILSCTLPFEHNDPADRFIGATAYKLGCQLATSDDRLRRLPWLNIL